MPINWKDPEAKDRLLAAVIAASANLNIKEVARVFGRGATYDAVEGQLRKPKKIVKELMEEADGRSGPVKAASRANETKQASESSAKSSVKRGRVTKTKKGPMARIKVELLEEDDALFDTAGYGADDDKTEV